ncbi:MAG TPA: hypothetical protein VFB59_03155 [Candidatus Saccharimonadales bacterium]|nr:hypothetical protein [Candidatus Saccharimonadales bacterium]
MDTLEGIWLSHYEYGQGPSNEPRFNDHVIRFTHVGNEWHGLSLPNKDGSEVSLILRQSRSQRRQFVGDWHVRTSPTGHYGGHKFNGLILLLIDEDGNELKGEWISATQNLSSVKHGSWTLRRETSPFGRMQLLIDSHPDLKQATDKQHSLLVEDKPFKNDFGEMVEGYVNYVTAAQVCETEFVSGYSKRTHKENAAILAAADQILHEFSNDQRGDIGYAMGMAFGESLALDIHNGKVPISIDDLVKYPALHKEVMVTMEYL